MLKTKHAAANSLGSSESSGDAHEGADSPCTDDIAAYKG